MLYWLIDVSDNTSVFNPFHYISFQFRYISFRTAGALITALVFFVLFRPAMINLLLRRPGENQAIHPDGVSSQPIMQVGTLTMGGVTLALSALASTVLWANLHNPYIWIVLGVTIGFGLVGFCGDDVGATGHGGSGLRVRTRVLIETVIAVAAWVAFVQAGRAPLTTSLVFPIFTGRVLDLRWLSLPFSAFIVVAAAHTVKSAGGLGWPVIVLATIVTASLGTTAYLAGNLVFANYFQVHYVGGAGELTVLCGALVGAGLGFLWFRAPPLGDTGALALGALLGTLAVATKQEFVFAVFGASLVLLRV
jgi:phospho-N-acetylmuramoyl-pentapeptide-transferase